METKQVQDITTIESDAIKAINYDAKLRVAGGNKLVHQPSCYGIALKWLLNRKKITYKMFAERYNGTTPQNINHIFNRTTKERFFEENVEQMCIVLKVKYDYFIKLSEEIEKLMEK